MTKCCHSSLDMAACLNCTKCAIPATCRRGVLHKYHLPPGSQAAAAAGAACGQEGGSSFDVKGACPGCPVACKRSQVSDKICNTLTGQARPAHATSVQTTLPATIGSSPFTRTRAPLDSAACPHKHTHGACCKSQSSRTHLHRILLGCEQSCKSAVQATSWLD